MSNNSIIDQIHNEEISVRDTNRETVDILFAGDFYMGNRTQELCRKNEYEKIYNEVLPALKQKDLSIVNLENPLTGEGNPIPKVGPHLKAPPDCIRAIQYGGFDVVALANNHILDHGAIGLKNTIAACQAGHLKTVGAGLSSDEIQKPLIVNVKSVRIGLINITENEFSTIKDGEAGANALDLISVYRQIIDARKNADMLFIIVHGGHEFYPLPSPGMVKMYRHFADIGVAAVIGHHPHCASGFEIWNGVPIFYSLGNFVFDWHEPQEEIWYKGYFVRLTVDSSSVVRMKIFPYNQFKDDAGLHFMEGAEKSSFLNRIAEYSEIIRDSSALDKRWREFCDSKKYEYLKNLLGLNRIESALLKRGIGAGYIFPRKDKLILLNLLRCEAHRDVSVEILKQLITEDKIK